MHIQTRRLYTRELIEADREDFFDMMGNPNVMNPIPQKAMNPAESDAMLDKLMHDKKFRADKTVRAICLEGNTEFMGLAGLLRNDNREGEIAYRLREKFWGQGYGTEIAYGILLYGFETLHEPIMTGDVNITNAASVAILNKFLTPGETFFNEKDQCTDQRFRLNSEEWNLVKAKFEPKLGYRAAN